MTFKKIFLKEDFLKALSSDWQKTSAIAKQIGCKNAWVIQTLETYPEVDSRVVSGGRFGTKEWKLKGE